MSYRSIKELQQVRSDEVGTAATVVKADESSELCAKMTKLRMLSDADKQLILQLQLHINSQKAELEKRTVTIAAIQRNFENLSSIASTERAELAALRERETRFHEEREASVAERKRMAAELESMRSSASAHEGTTLELAEATRKAAEERGRLHAQLEALRSQLAHAEKAHRASAARAAELEARAANAAAAAERAEEARLAAAEAATRAGEGAALLGEERAKATQRAEEAEVALQKALRHAQQQVEEAATANEGRAVAEARLCEVQEARAAVEARLCEVQEARATVEAQLREAQEARAAVEARLREVEGQHTSSAIEAGNAHAERQAAQRRLDEAEKETRRLHAELSALQVARSAAEMEARRAAEAADAALREERQRSDAARQRVVDELDERLRAVSQREAVLRASIQQVMRAEEAMEACLTCMACMGIMKDGASCVPCGHTFCSSCLRDAVSCPECDGPTELPVTIGMLGTLVSKFNFQKQTLATLATNNGASASSSKFAAAIGSRSAA
mmetsp:Transcript_31560/g.78647  ORF Transcript_31560/g.78647 Transcript_31560/m.78647 type:complete len:509 (+) Transcript_31560:196-1722(+)